MSKLFSSFCYCSFVWSLLIIDCNCISVHLLVELDHLLLIWRVRDLLSSIDYIYFDTHTHTRQLEAPTCVHSCSKWYSIIVSAAHTYTTRLHSPPKRVSWLRQIVRQWGNSKPLIPGSLDYVAPLLVALALRHRDEELLSPLLEAFGALARVEPTLVGSPHYLPPFPIHYPLLSPLPLYTHTVSLPPSIPPPPAVSALQS